MKRVILLVALAATPAAAQSDSTFNPYNPYGDSLGRGTVILRPYSSLDRLNLRRQSRAMPFSYSVRGPFTSGASSYHRAAGFRQFPNYPRLAATQPGHKGTNSLAATIRQPIPFNEPLPGEPPCDPYTDENGCLDCDSNY